MEPNPLEKVLPEQIQNNTESVTPAPETINTKKLKPEIETFEHDIETEIRTKSLSVADMASSASNPTNTPITNKEPSRISLPLIIISGCVAVILIGAALYVYLTTRNTRTPTVTPSTSLTTTSTTNTVTTAGNTEVHPNTIASLLPNVAQNVGSYISSIKKENTGYVLYLLQFNPVFAYTFRNESTFRDEALSLLKEGTSTAGFTDTNSGGIDMRILNDATNTLVYAFFDGTALAISTSSDGIIKIHNDILKQ